MPHRIGPTARLRTTDKQPEARPMATKPNYQFERRERERLKAIKNEQKTAAKKKARERTRTDASTGPSNEDDPNRST